MGGTSAPNRNPPGFPNMCSSHDPYTFHRAAVEYLTGLAEQFAPSKRPKATAQVTDDELIQHVYTTLQRVGRDLNLSDDVLHRVARLSVIAIRGKLG